MKKKTQRELARATIARLGGHYIDRMGDIGAEVDRLWTSPLRAGNTLAKRRKLIFQHLSIDGTTHKGGETLQGDGRYAPFYVFDEGHQDYLAGPFKSRRQAAAWLIAQHTKAIAKLRRV